jgi:hypothetical protein
MWTDFRELRQTIGGERLGVSWIVSVKRKAR